MRRSREVAAFSGLGLAASVMLGGTAVYAWSAEPHSSICTGLQVKEAGNLAISASVTYDSLPNQDPVVGVSYSFGDGTNEIVAENPSGPPTNLVIHPYAKSGNYLVKATIQVQNGQHIEEIAPNSDCQSGVTIP